MAVYLYAICDLDAAVTHELNTLADTPIRILRAGGLAALVCDRPPRGCTRVEDSLPVHERVLEALIAFHDLLPARSGTELDSDAAVAALLVARGQEFRDALAYIAGAAELGVHACIDGPPLSSENLPREPIGHEYLARSVGIHHRVRALADRVEHALAPLARAHTVRMPAPASATVRAAFLVAHEDVEEFTQRTAALDAEMVDGRIFCTGPWPPYSFSNAGAARR